MCKFVFIKYFSVVCNFMHSRKCYVDKVLSRHSPSLQERYKHVYFHKRCALGPLMYKNRYQCKLIINSYFFKILKMIHYKYMRCVYTQTREVWIMQNYFILWQKNEFITQKNVKKLSPQYKIAHHILSNVSSIRSIQKIKQTNKQVKKILFYQQNASTCSFISFLLWLCRGDGINDTVLSSVSHTPP